LDYHPFEIVPYHPRLKAQWDDLVSHAANSSLIHFRDYMEYHQDRFEDRSFLIYHHGKLVALLPLEGEGKELYSHRGLTFGGLLTVPQLNASEMAGLIQHLLNVLRNLGVVTLSVKEMPSFFWTCPDHLARWRTSTEHLNLEAKDLKSFYAVPLPAKVEDRGKRWGIKKATAEGLQVRRSGDFETFWRKILEPNLADRHNAKPVHSLFEIENLREKFPETIQLWTVVKEDEMMGGCVLYLHREVAHCQYLSASPSGRANRALDLLFGILIQRLSPHYSYLSLGTAINTTTNLPDRGLVHWKESWGAKSYTTPNWRLRVGSN
jgi:hypothetical protein